MRVFLPFSGLELVDVSAELGADVVECFVQTAGQGRHACSGAKSDQRNNQSVFDEILALFAAGQILELDIDLQKHGIHSGFSP